MTVTNNQSRMWKIKEPQPELLKALCAELGISFRLASILINRGFDNPQSAHDFLYPSLHNLPDPFLMAGMEKAVDRLVQAFRRQEKIFVFGDYDMDGISATAILVDYLRRTGFQADYSIPSRLTDGYGLNLESVKKAKLSGADLAVTVDCGISDYEEIVAANSIGLDIIVTDHHQIPEKIPPAFAIINPHLEDCCYPDKVLAGVGVAFNLMMALRKRLRQTGLTKDVNLLQYLDLVALGTVADVMPLTGVNRIFVSFGLAEINKSYRRGLRALIALCHFQRGQLIKARDLAFRLAPRVNAVGRIADAGTAVELFLTKDQAVATRHAQYLEECNERRRQIEKDIKNEVDELISKDESLISAKVVLLASENWHPGVVGIVSSRIAESYGKPAILIALENGVGRGSGRSVPGLNLVKILEHCQSQLIRFGGHEQAVGLTVAEENIATLRIQIEDFISSSEPLQAKLSDILLDGILKPNEVNHKLLKELELLQPLGQGNPEPAFILPSMQLVKATAIGQSGKRHMKFIFADNKNTRLPGIAFNFIGTCPQAGENLDLAFTPEENIWQGKSEIRINLVDFRPGQCPEHPKSTS
ncbi:MAG: single-stranded-DNA-specific exonuclease RecJ [Deltaproteobacteria bacterium]|nr:single-stranded-DNA-specific exonuclease RecJ [Candidatus Tharpella sp.]